jgi:hypothetical protein
MSRAEYMRNYRDRKKSDSFIDERYKHDSTKKTPCFSCGTLLEPIKNRGPRKYCNNGKCQHDYLRKQAVENGIAGIGSTKRYLADTRGYKCEECNNSEWMNKPLTLELDHINGDFNDNSLENVRLLCPNCHSQTDTFRVRNLGKGRSKVKKEAKPFYLR